MISLIIPARNEERFIADTLRSIFEQKVREGMEVLVVDNGSIDKTAEVVMTQFPQVKLVSESRAGTNSARQAGFLQSVGELVIFLDADCRPSKNWIQSVADKLRSDTKIVAVSGPYRFYDFPWYWNLANEVLMYLMIYPYSFLSNHWGSIAQMTGGCMAIKRSALSAIGGFDISRVFYGDDTGTAVALRAEGKICFSPRYFVYSSARRYVKLGVVKTFYIYLRNMASMWLYKKPFGNGAEMVR